MTEIARRGGGPVRISCRSGGPFVYPANRWRGTRPRGWCAGAARPAGGAPRRDLSTGPPMRPCSHEDTAKLQRAPSSRTGLCRRLRAAPHLRGRPLVSISICCALVEMARATQPNSRRIMTAIGPARPPRRPGRLCRHCPQVIPSGRRCTCSPVRSRRASFGAGSPAMRVRRRRQGRSTVP